jgi:membrane-bound lytic murein transglycosylase D
LDIPPESGSAGGGHRVEAGETLTPLAKKYHVTAPAIAAANSLGRTDVLSPGDKLIIPASQPAAEAKSRLVRYRVRKGDTLGGIADQFSVSPEELRKWNGLKAARVSRGMVLRVYTIGGGPETVLVHKQAAAKKRSSSVNTASAATHAKKTP